ncbi:hypothetical protein EG328_004761 [Venturia inaequalis]|uniref:Uncharacterized protein n=1 Tax=Venturia inaequalis TaxID=5025 RepID=A0A8H3VCZ4_VENIN|nr:hypothetical protein EG328_004761 [Venturia inaequalis]RDI87187.1 hypothetical protein Vi05172_g2639 [Venturia inaequalis]
MSKDAKYSREYIEAVVGENTKVRHDNLVQTQQIAYLVAQVQALAAENSHVKNQLQYVCTNSQGLVSQLAEEKAESGRKEVVLAQKQQEVDDALADNRAWRDEVAFLRHRSNLYCTYCRDNGHHVSGCDIRRWDQGIPHA